jgi:formate transporter
MVCLAVWLSYSGHSLSDKIFAMLLPIGMFVASGFEHSIANMFLIPLAIIIRDYAPAAFWQGIHATPDQFPALTMSNFIIDNLIPVTLGNIIGGGLLVGLTYWVIYLRPGDQRH